MGNETRNTGKPSSDGEHQRSIGRSLFSRRTTSSAGVIGRPPERRTLRPANRVAKDDSPSVAKYRHSTHVPISFEHFRCEPNRKKSKFERERLLSSSDERVARSREK